jgi:hypothetical protein
VFPRQNKRLELPVSPGEKFTNKKNKGNLRFWSEEIHSIKLAALTSYFEQQSEFKLGSMRKCLTKTTHRAFAVVAMTRSNVVSGGVPSTPPTPFADRCDRVEEYTCD